MDRMSVVTCSDGPAIAQRYYWRSGYKGKWQAYTCRTFPKANGADVELDKRTDDRHQGAAVKQEKQAMAAGLLIRLKPGYRHIGRSSRRKPYQAAQVVLR